VRQLISGFTRELARMRGDKGAMLVLVGAIFIYAAFYPLPYSREVLKDLPVSVVDLDRSVASREFSRMLNAHELLRAVTAETRTEAESAVRHGDTSGVVVIPQGFERKLMRGERISVPTYVDTSYFLAYRQVLTGVAEVTGTFSAGAELRRAGLGFTTRSGMREPVKVLFRPLFNPTESYRQYIVPAVLVLILQQTLLVGIGMLRGGAREPDESLQSMTGAAMAYFVLYCIHASIYFAVVFRLYNFEQHASLTTLALITVPFLLAVIFLGFAISSMFSRREAAIPILLFTSLPALFLAGFAWPVESMPPFVRALAALLPSTHAIVAILRATLMGSPAGSLLPQVGALATLALIYFVAASAILAFRRRTSST
jgi:ABC-2 type transport system permease protein